ncbi:hypothetical protein NCTC12673_gp158 [Campylobacter phage NCTC12673]|uniref:Uncharacterized protein n=2 Tax=Fletchervirus NCTC12673 TaxID=934027 RepID=A0A1B0XW12_9CAUD|nr:hypothetical protein NCTC12673_gp158 [Campylobacter phage NCTC12673]YP_009321643.1 hypothetical protein BOX06_gp044 [Campylobacter phage PC14]AEA86501.1 hypothetical protein [Campylobacter phage NCTC12673]ANH51337.1 hypothetical protein PC14_00044 [Campylobacter phage PC14]
MKLIISLLILASMAFSIEVCSFTKPLKRGVLVFDNSIVFICIDKKLFVRNFPGETDYSYSVTQVFEEGMKPQACSCPAEE